MDLLDESQMTPEQKFIFMLEERVLKLEEQMQVANKYLIGEEKILPDYVQKAVDHYKTLYANNTLNEKEEMKAKMKTVFPEYVYNLISDGVYNDFTNIYHHLQRPSESGYMYFNVYRLFEKLGDKVTPELIAWIETIVK